MQLQKPNKKQSSGFKNNSMRLKHGSQGSIVRSKLRTNTNKNVSMKSDAELRITNAKLPPDLLKFAKQPDSDSEPFTPISVEKMINEEKVKTNHKNIVKFFKNKKKPVKLIVPPKRMRFVNKRRSAPHTNEQYQNLLKTKNPNMYPNKPVLGQHKLGEKKSKLLSKNHPKNSQANNIRIKTKIKMHRQSGNIFSFWII